jgi:hypothetical protein
MVMRAAHAGGDRHGEPTAVFWFELVQDLFKRECVILRDGEDERLTNLAVGCLRWTSIVRQPEPSLKVQPG